MEGVTSKVGRPGVDPCQPASRLDAVSGAWLAAMQLSIEPPQLAQRPLEGTRVRNHCAGGEHRQVPYADVYANNGGRTVAGWEVALHLDGEGDEPAVSRSGHRRGEDAGGALLQTAGELTGGLMRFEHTDSR